MTIRLPLLSLALLAAVWGGCDPVTPNGDPSGGAAEPDAAPVDSAAEPATGGDDCSFVPLDGFDSFVPLERNIAPAATDPAITTLPENAHVVALATDRPLRPELFVLLGGSYGKPTNMRNITRAAAFSGYRVINLAYPNDPSVGKRCTDPATGQPYAPECHALVRQEIISGEDVAPWVEIAPAESIEHRLSALLATLSDEYPSEGWSGYTGPDGAIDWTRAVVSGFSQGGGMAGMIARDHAVARAVYFSKGADGHAPWYLDPRATPPEREFALVHRGENAFSFAGTVFGTWGVVDLGDFVDADIQSAPYGCTHLLSTGLEPRHSTGFVKAHNSIGTDFFQPLDQSGQPAMAGAWVYMMTMSPLAAPEGDASAPSVDEPAPTTGDPALGSDPAEMPEAAPDGVMQRVYLDDPEAVCNDGTRAILYIRPGHMRTNAPRSGPSPQVALPPNTSARWRTASRPKPCVAGGDPARENPLPSSATVTSTAPPVQRRVTVRRVARAWRSTFEIASRTKRYIAVEYSEKTGSPTHSRAHRSGLRRSTASNRLSMAGSSPSRSNTTGRSRLTTRRVEPFVRSSML